jgi:hypothetical protein
MRKTESFSPRDAAIEQARSLYRSRSGPDWRWRLANALHVAPEHWMSEISDDVVRSAASFLSDCDEFGPEAASDCNQVFAAAESFWRNSPLRESFTILVLGNCDDEAIASQTALDVSLVCHVRGLFFDIEANRNATSWIDAYVMAAERNAGRYEQAARYRRAFYGGPSVASVLVAPDPPELTIDASRLHSLEESLNTKARAVLEMPIQDARDSIRFTNMLLDHELAKKRIELEREKFQHRCELELREQDAAERRIALAEEKHRNRVEREKNRVGRKRDSIAAQRQLGQFQQTLQSERRRRELHEASQRAIESPLAALSWQSPPERSLPINVPTRQIDNFSNTVALTQPSDGTERELVLTST